MMELSGHRVLIIGLGKTGIATAKFLVGKGSSVIIADEKGASELRDAIGSLEDMNVELRVGTNNGSDILSDIDLVVPSPGVPPYNGLLADAQALKIPIMSEIELAYRFIKKPIIAITGTNGKTTTTKLIGEIFTRWGKKVFVGGNIGNPLIEFAGSEGEEYLVVEVSSFQLQWVDMFHPFIAILLNTSRDHLDYHRTFAEYRKIKERLFTNQTAGDLAVLNADDPRSTALSREINADIAYFSSSSPLGNGIFKDGDVLRYKGSGGMDEEYPLSSIKLTGSHNFENIMAAILVMRRCGCPPEVIKETLKMFEGLPHRMEFAGVKDGVEFYNDSKGTNVDAVKRALEAFSRPVILLLGGRNKGGDFRLLARLIGEKVEQLILFGEAQEEIGGQIGCIVRTKKVKRLKDAVDTAWKCSRPGDRVLFSPGCASFDEFAHYRERGDVFKGLVKQIIDN